MTVFTDRVPGDWNDHFEDPGRAGESNGDSMKGENLWQNATILSRHQDEALLDTRRPYPFVRAQVYRS